MILIKNHFSVHIFFGSTNFFTQHFFSATRVHLTVQIAHLIRNLTALLTQHGILMATLFFFSPYVFVICRCIYYSVFAIRLVSLWFRRTVCRKHTNTSDSIQTFCIFLACFPFPDSIEKKGEEK